MNQNYAEHIVISFLRVRYAFKSLMFDNFIKNFEKIFINTYNTYKWIFIYQFKIAQKNSPLLTLIAHVRDRLQ